MIGRAVQMLRLLPRLGLGNMLAVALYRYHVKRRLFEAMLPPRAVVKPRPFWQGQPSGEAVDVSDALRANILEAADEICSGIFRQFASQPVEEGETPEWFKGVYVTSSTQHYSRVAVNAVAGEDVKLSWDLARMHWAPKLALAAAVSEGAARAGYLARLDHLTIDWLNENGYQRGVNWACGHEVSVRGIQLMLTNLIMTQHVGMQPSAQLLTMMGQSWHRVHVTHAYGRAQQNNHSLTELVFLIYGAAFLRHYGVKIATQATVQKLLRELPKLIDRLVLGDGGSAMYSTNYSRVFCDIIAYAKLFDDAFSTGVFAQPMLQKKATAMLHFLSAVIEPVSGRIPLIGHNDGSLHCVQFCPFHQATPSLLLLGAAFGLPLPAAAASYCDAVWLFGATPSFAAQEPQPTTREQWFDQFGLAIFDQPSYRAYLKYPRNRFRPSQQDFLHLDVWVNGENLLCDSGTYSYNARSLTGDDTFSKPSAHNVPTLLNASVGDKISPFLYAFWPTTQYSKRKGGHRFRVRCEGGVMLERTIIPEPHRLVLRDCVTGGGAWGVVMNGIVDESNETMAAQLGNAAFVRFTNIEHVTISNAMRAENYQSLMPSKRLVAQPMEAKKPIVTTLIFGQ
jgi:hypothetical protein